MFESQEKKSEPSPEPSILETTKKIFSQFLERSDEPGEFLSGIQKDKLSEASRFDLEALKKWEKDRNSKYRINSLFAPLGIAKFFLTDPESKKIPKEEKENLLKRVQKSLADLDGARGSKISEELVGEVVDIVKEIEKYFK
ncbi:MAG: hypothetical protein Q7S81_01295 [bacterium]|nr:hypothetical protein [bacterium]